MQRNFHHILSEQYSLKYRSNLRLGTVRPRRIVAVYDVGRVINEKLARSQFIGGIVWGVSLALHEDTQVDPRDGRIVNANLSDYRVP